ncbi:MAG: DUF3047 domain-containing protein [Burkholderiales bacterium]|nr:DUF3047 domain-containing protein [Burkholderiales bacterium]
MNAFGRLLAVLAGLLAAGCAQLPQASSPHAAGAEWDKARWAHYTLPGKRAAAWRPVRSDGREAVSVTADSAASMLRRTVRIEPQDMGAVRFSWKVPELMAQADLALREAADSPVRVILAFEGDRNRFSARDALTAELVRALTGEEMPYATLMYVWCNKREPGTVIRSPRTDRIRKVVLESGPARLDRWLDYERDIRADYERAFGEAPGALVGIAIMTDSDNTRSRTRALYGPISVIPAKAGIQGFQAF